MAASGQMSSWTEPTELESEGTFIQV
jgi:hypothetical protein